MLWNKVTWLGIDVLQVPTPVHPATVRIIRLLRNFGCAATSCLICSSFNSSLWKAYCACNSAILRSTYYQAWGASWTAETNNVLQYAPCRPKVNSGAQNNDSRSTEFWRLSLSTHFESLIEEDKSCGECVDRLYLTGCLLSNLRRITAAPVLQQIQYSSVCGYHESPFSL